MSGPLTRLGDRADKPIWHGPGLDLLPELAAAASSRLATPLRLAWRRNWFYRRLLQGKLSDRMVCHPNDGLPRKLEEADQLLRGRFRFAGESVDIQSGSVFDKTPPSRAWAEALHGFAFLPPLAMAGGDPARTLAVNLISQWLKRYPRYCEPEWNAEVTARRLINLFVHGRFVLPNSEVVWRSKLLVSLREQSRQLARIADKAASGLPRFEAATAVALSGACLDDSPKRLAQGLARLEAELARQILPDGGHADRSPETLLHAFRHLLMVLEALTAISHPAPPALLSARDRMAPMLRFFRHGDGALALFHGGDERDRATVSGVLARGEAHGLPFGHAPHSKYQRLAAAKTIALMDVGTLPAGSYANTAHAGCLAFEYSAGPQRIVVNCGDRRHWDGVLRSTAAHSTITVADTSMGQILSPGLARDLLGPRMSGGPHLVSTERHETPDGVSVSGSHDAYLRKFGLTHTRQLTLSSAGTKLIGHDTLTPADGKRGQVGYAIRFHLHPDIRITPSQGGGMLLKLPSGEGWRFRAGAHAEIEESIYAGGGSPRKTDQIVISGQAGSSPVQIGWTFERMGAA